MTASTPKRMTQPFAEQRLRTLDFALLAVLAFVPRIVMAWAIPLWSGSVDPNCAPDELAHYWVARELAHLKFEPWRPGGFSIYSAFPPVQYAAQAVSLAAGSVLGIQFARFASPEPLVVGYEWARLGSVLLGVLTTLLLAGATWEVTRSRMQALVGGTVGAVFPQLVFVGAYVNSDSYTIAAGTFLILALIRWFRAPHLSSRTILLGASLGCVSLGKLSGFYMIPPTIGLIAARLAREGRDSKFPVVMLALSIVSVAGPILAWHAFQADDDPFGISAYSKFISGHWERHAPPEPDPLKTFFGYLGMSAFGTFQNMDLFLPSAVYWIAFVFAIVGLGSSVFACYRSSSLSRWLLCWLIGCTAINIMLVWWNSWVIDFQPQGRYVVLNVVCWTIAAIIGPLRVFGSPLREIWVGTAIFFLAAATVLSIALVVQHPCLP